MKKITSILAAALIVLSLAGCNENNEKTSNESSSLTSTEICTSSSSESSSSTEGSAESSSSTASEESKPEESSSSTTTEESKPEESSSSTTTEESKPEESSSSSTTEESKPEEPGITDGAALLNASYDKFEEDLKFPVMGGDYNNIVDGKAGAFDISDAAGFETMSIFPQTEIGKIDSAATMVHMMNANTFTGVAVHVKEGTDMAALAKEIENKILNNQWMCGFPDKLVIVTVEDYIAYAFGYEEAVTAFSKNLVEAYSGAKTVCDTPIIV